MKPTHPHARRRRARIAIGVVLLLVSVLGLTFFRLQVLTSGAYTLRARSNILRPLDIPAARGTIYDRNGRVIADNVPAYSVSILPASTDTVLATLDRLAPYLDLGETRLDALRRTASVYTGRPILLDGDVPFEAVSAIEERRSRFPNVLIEMEPKRRYVSGPAVAHVVGTIGEINADELGSPDFPNALYEQGMVIGKTGIERKYERRLQGRRGVRYVEVDARLRVVGDFGGSVRRPAEAGQDLHLNVDLALQEWIHRIFPKDLSGAVVALDPADGGVLALYSHPTFDPNDFVGGIDVETWEGLRTDTLRPIFNRTVLGVFPPASTFKPLVAAMALEMGAVTPDDLMPESCTGGYQYGGRYWRCWDPTGHGKLDLEGAIRDSCDVYFYQLGLEIGLDRFLTTGGELGLATRCGIDLPEESRGQFPLDRSWWERVHGYTAREGEVLPLAIGQGPNSQTPLKVAQLYVALARDGSAPAPTLAQEPDTVVEGWNLDLRPEHLDVIRGGLAAVTGPGGTARLSQLEHWQLVGKTGTAESNQSQAGTQATDAWFAGMAGPWGEDPEIVVVAMVERGGGGSATAAPLVAKISDYYLRRKYGIPTDTIQTLREHYESGRPAPWARIGNDR